MFVKFNLLLIDFRLSLSLDLLDLFKYRSKSLFETIACSPASKTNPLCIVVNVYILVVLHHGKLIICEQESVVCSMVFED
mmetsp:Transcript_10954/g.16994  ORF Transcript_10954/g.16994 Transcript_10954/m.16994 type:complete len:80 (+) Transcript_10954:1444-1683(+)